MNRRQFLAATAASSIALMTRAQSVTQPATQAARYRIAACDWMMLKRQKLGAIQLAKDCGFDGLEVDMGPLSKNPTFTNELVKPEFRQQYQDKLAETGITISSLAMSAFYGQSFPQREIEQPVSDCIETMKLMNVKVAFLPLGVYGDLVQRPEVRPAVLERLKLIAAHAEKAGVIIGVETALDAEGDVKLLDEIASPAIRIYFNFSNALQNNRDLYKELKTLGKDRICQIHCTNQDGKLLKDDPKIDMKRVKETLDEMGWSGWLVVERSRQADKGRDVRYNFSANAAYLKSVFQTGN